MALAALLLTSMHHAYGAYIYDTPWRLHVVLVSGLAAVALIGSLRVLRRRSADVVGEIASWVFAAIVFILPVAGIGVFEGGYNHAVKDALYFSGASLRVMYRLFPPPAYELPNDAFFEITGVQQLAVVVVTGYYLYFLVRNRWRQRGALSLGLESQHHSSLMRHR